jgi:Tfp pilus assembly protein PilF
MKMKYVLLFMLAVGYGLVLAGCQALSAGRPGKDVQPGTQRVAQAAVEEGAKQYDAGNFQGAIRVLSITNEINLAKPETQIKAHKLLAFSYCATGKTSFCHTEFVKILAIDPGFSLSKSERTHPIWGPVFDSVRTNSSSTLSR